MSKYQQAVAQQKLKAQSLAPSPIPPKSELVFAPTTYTDGAKQRLKDAPIADAYQRWFSPTEIRGSSENRLTNCFNSNAHSNGDRNPSMDLNVANNVYVCHGCDAKGDMVDLAANAAGIVPLGSQVDDSQVHEAVKFGCESLFADMQGKFISKNGNWQYQPITFDPAQYAAQEPVSLTPDPQTITKPPTEATIDWRNWVPQGTPLRAYMEIVTQDDNPEEFHLFNFLQLIGLVLGREVTMGGDYPLVHANTLICLIGVTGQGKSKTLSYIADIISQRKMWFDETDHQTQGIRMIRGVGSGEVLVDSLGHSIANPAVVPGGAPGQRLINHSPRSLVIWSEFSNLAAKTKATGSTMSDKVIDMHDLVSPMAAITRAHHSKAYNVYGSAITTTQLEAIRNLFSKEHLDSGFLNRWIFVVGTSKPYVPWNSKIDISPVISYMDSLYIWLNSLTKQGKATLLRSSDADTEAARFLVEVVRPRKLNEETAAMFTRMDLLFKKLILICSANMMEKEISLIAVYQAEKLWLYLESCMLKVTSKISDDPSIEIERFIIDIIKESEKAPDKKGYYGTMPRDLKQRVTRKFKIDAEYVERKISQMERDGAIVKMDTRTVDQKNVAKSRPITRWVTGSGDS